MSLRWFGEQMNREEVVALMKQLSAEHLIDPTFVLIEKRTQGNYQLRVKADYDHQGIAMFTQKFNLVMHEDKVKGFLTIYRP
jgi:hypothetical protein